MTGGFWEEDAVEVPPLTKGAIAHLGQRIIEQLCPDHLLAPKPLDAVHLIENVLDQYGINVYPATPKELGPRWGATDPAGSGCITILLHEEQWDALYAGSRRAHQARATFAHELSHAVLHIPEIRRRRDIGLVEGMLSRVKSGQIPAYRNSEWQAYALAGCLLVPLSTLRLTTKRDLFSLAETYGISTGMMRAHAKRFGIRFHTSTGGLKIP